MQITRRFAALGLLLALAVFASSADAAFDRVDIAPGGNISAVSLGPVTITVPGSEIRCTISLGGRFSTTAMGNLDGTLTQHPLVGEFSNGAAANCTPSGLGVTLLFPSFTPWEIFVQSVGFMGTATWAVLNAQILIRGAGYACLYTLLLGMSYDGDLFTITTISALAVTTLAGSVFRCITATPPSIAGTFNLLPDQRFTLIPGV